MLLIDEVTSSSALEALLQQAVVQYWTHCECKRPL